MLSDYTLQNFRINDFFCVEANRFFLFVEYWSFFADSYWKIETLEVLFFATCNLVAFESSRKVLPPSYSPLYSQQLYQLGRHQVSNFCCWVSKLLRFSPFHLAIAAAASASTNNLSKVSPLSLIKMFLSPYTVYFIGHLLSCLVAWILFCSCYKILVSHFDFFVENGVASDYAVYFSD